MKFSNVVSTLLLTAGIAVTTTGCDSKEERERKYLERAQEQIEQGDLVKARLEIRNALQINNQSAEALYLRALVFEKEQLWRKMMDELNAAVTADPSYMPAQIKRVTYFYGFGPQADSVTTATLQSILKLEPENVEAITMLGRVALRAGDVDEAKKQAELALSLDDTSIHPFVLLGEIYKDEPDKALAYIEQGLESNPGSAELILTRIQVFSQRGDVDAVLAEYDRLVAAHPENLDYAREMITYMSDNDRVSDAEQFLLSRIEGKPDVSEYKVWLMQLLLAANEQQRAIELAQTFIAENTDEPQLYYLLSDVYLSMNQAEEAVGTLEKLLKRLPEDSAEASKAKVRVAEITVKAGDVASAQGYLDSVLASDPENPSALILSAELLLREGDTEEAIIRLRSALRREPDSFRARMALANAHEANGSMDLAMDSYQAALELEPANVRLALKIATMFYEQSETDAANRLLQRYLVSEMTAPSVAPALVDSFAGEKKWVEAMEVVDALKAQEANRSIGLYLEGGIYFQQGDYDKAIATFESLLEQEPGSGRTLAAIVRAKVAQSGRDAAIEYLEGYAAEHPGETAPHELLAGLYADAGEFDTAVKSYEDALALQPGNINMHLALSRLHQAAGDVDAAVRSVESAEAIAPDNPNLAILKAGFLESQQRYGEAAELYESVLVRDPSNIIAANNLAMILVDHLPGEKNLARALEVTESLEQANEPVFLDTRAWVLYIAGEYEQARTLLETAMSDPDQVIPVYQYHLGMVYAKLGDKDAAREQLEAALESGAEFAGMEQAKAALESL